MHIFNVAFEDAVDRHKKACVKFHLTSSFTNLKAQNN